MKHQPKSGWVLNSTSLKPFLFFFQTFVPDLRPQNRSRCGNSNSSIKLHFKVFNYLHKHSLPLFHLTLVHHLSLSLLSLTHTHTHTHTHILSLSLLHSLNYCQSWHYVNYEYFKKFPVKQVITFAPGMFFQTFFSS